MNRYLHITTLLLLWALSIHAVLPANRGALPANYTNGAQVLGESKNSDTGGENSQASQFGIFHEGESSLELLNRVPAPPVFSDSDDNQHLLSALELQARRVVASRLLSSKTVRCSQSATSIIYPFHSFL